MRLAAILVAGVCGAAFEYDERTTLREAELTQVAYCVDTATTRHADLPEASMAIAVIEEKSSGGKAVVGHDATDGTVFVAYRGSESLQNFVKDFQGATVSPYPAHRDVSIHRGMYGWYKNLNVGGVLDAVEAAGSTFGTKKLKLTGHSSGGAVATILSLEITLGLKLTSFELVKVTTFGSPRVGDANFVSLFESLRIPMTRVTRAYDFAPHYPRQGKYRHVLTEVHYFDDHHYKICHGSDDPTCASSCSVFRCHSSVEHRRYLGVAQGIASCRSSGAAANGRPARGSFTSFLLPFLRQ